MSERLEYFQYEAGQPANEGGVAENLEKHGEKCDQAHVFLSLVLICETDILNAEEPLTCLSSRTCEQWESVHCYLSLRMGGNLLGL